MSKLTALRVKWDKATWRTTSLLALGLCEAVSLGGLVWCVLPQSPRWNYARPKSARASPALSAVSRQMAGQGLHSTSVLRLGTSLSVGSGQTPVLVLAPLLESLGLGNIYYIISWNFKNVYHKNIDISGKKLRWFPFLAFLL